MERILQTITCVAFASRAAGVPLLEAGIEELFEEFYRRVCASGGCGAQTLRTWLDLAEAWCITRALRESRGNRSATARALGIGRRTLYTKIEKLKILATHEHEGPQTAN